MEKQAEQRMYEAVDRSMRRFLDSLREEGIAKTPVGQDGRKADGIATLSYQKEGSWCHRLIRLKTKISKFSR